MGTIRQKNSQNRNKRQKRDSKTTQNKTKRKRKRKKEKKGKKSQLTGQNSAMRATLKISHNTVSTKNLFYIAVDVLTGYVKPN